MVGKSKIIILSIFIFSLTFSLSFTVFPKNSLACHLGGPYDYYQTCNSGIYCTYDSQCGSGEISAYDFAVDWGGCTMGFAAGQYYSASCVVSDIIPTCTCYGPEAKWYTSASYNGHICKRRSGAACDVSVKEGKWDSSDSKCVICNGKREAGYFDCSGDYSGDNKCESACGADAQCDEKYPYSSLPDVCEEKQLKVIRFCDGDCTYHETVYTCDSFHVCDVRGCGEQTYYCVYNNGWKWSTTKPSNFCCSDNDCSGYDPNTHLKMYCDPNTHTCKTKPSCALPEDCEDKWCCDTITGTKACKAQGTIISSGGKSYICDPPEGFINFSDENTNIQINKKLTLLDLLINPFYYFLER